MIRVCVVHLEVYEQWKVDDISSARAGDSNHLRGKERVQQAWLSLWNAIPNALRYYWDVKGWTHPDTVYLTYRNTYLIKPSHDEYLEQDRGLASTCLRRIEFLRKTPAAGFGLLDPLFSAELRTALELFALPQRVDDIPSHQSRSSEYLHGHSTQTGPSALVSRSAPADG